MLNKKSDKLSKVSVKKNYPKARQYRSVVNSPIVTDIINTPPSETDPFGAYTGNPVNPYEKPVQDADDL